MKMNIPKKNADKRTFFIADCGYMGLIIYGVEWCIKNANTDVPKSEENSLNSMVYCY